MKHLARGLALAALGVSVAVAGSGNVGAQESDAAAKRAKLLAMVKPQKGFAATMFAAPPEVGYPTCLAAAPDGALFIGIDENGSIDAKPDRGKIVRAVDADGDGTAEKFAVFAKVDSPRGVFHDGKTLYVMHPPFVRAVTDTDGDGVADKDEVLVEGLGFDLKFRGADHTTNGMQMGIDGWLYIAVGDYGFVKAKGKDGTERQMWGGGVVRVRPDGSGLEIVSFGQRNIYDVAIDPYLNLFTRDNTNDGGGWDVRLSHVIWGGNYGYPRLFKNFAEDVVQPLAVLGGGSPCGMLFVDEPGLPKEIGHALYSVEWGRNFIYRHPLQKNGAGFKAEQTPFVEIPRPTDMEVDGRGNIYIASWHGGQFTYKGPDVGFVVRVRQDGQKANALPELARAGDAELVKYVTSDSAYLRLQAQREILRRGKKDALAQGLEQAAAGQGALAGRVAAIFTLRQLLGTGATQTLVKLSNDASVREFALKALSDIASDSKEIPSAPLVKALNDDDARVRLAAVQGLSRLNKTEASAAILPLVEEADPLISHSAINALVNLKAADVCLKALDQQSPGRVPKVLLALRRMHEPKVVDGLVERLGKVREPALRQGILTALARLHFKEAEWDGKWWGTRPDTSGPYFKVAPWEQTDRIAGVLEKELETASPGGQQALALELRKHKIESEKATALLLELAEKDPAFGTKVVDLLLNGTNIPPSALKLLAATASSEKAEPALRARAIRGLQRVGGTNGTEAAVAALAQLSKLPRVEGDLNGVREEFVRDFRHGQNVNYFVKLIESEDAGEREIGYAVLAQLASRRPGGLGGGGGGNRNNRGGEARLVAEKAIDAAWAKPEATISLLRGIAIGKADAYSFQVRVKLKDETPAIREAATLAAKQLRLDQKSDDPNRVVVSQMKYEDVVAAALKEPGDQRAGAFLFAKQGCVACHTVSHEDAPKGPYLGDIATRYSRAELLESILKPSEKVAQGFVTHWYETKQRDRFEGFVVRESGEEIELRDITGQATVIKTKDVTKSGKLDTSMMPPGLADDLTPGEVASILAYLEWLKTR